MGIELGGGDECSNKERAVVREIYRDWGVKKRGEGKRV